MKPAQVVSTCAVVTGSMSMTQLCGSSGLSVGMIVAAISLLKEGA